MRRRIYITFFMFACGFGLIILSEQLVRDLYTLIYLILFYILALFMGSLYYMFKKEKEMNK